jgi:hypothetical protein
MMRKSHPEPVFRFSNFLWMTLVLLLVALIWRGLGAFLAFVEDQNVLGHYTDIGSCIVFIVNHLSTTDWPSETFSFLGQVLGLAILFQVGPLGERFAEPDAEEERNCESAQAVFRRNDEPEAL